MQSSKKLSLAVVLISIMIFISGCGGLGPSDPKKTDFYEGSEGWDVRFLPNSPPTRIYYEADGTLEDNSFDIELELRNKGASMGWGALWISGYDPNLIKVDGVEALPSGFKDCVFDWSNIIGGNNQFYASCMGIDYTQQGNDWEVTLNDIGENLEKYGIGLWDSDKYLSDLDITFGDSEGDGGTHFGINFNNPNVDLDYYNHGARMVATVAAGFNIDFFNGQEFVLPADDYRYPGGGLEYPTFHATIRNWPLGLDETTVPFMITSCYSYATYASPNVCIDSNPYSEDRKVCRSTQGVSLSGTQGAPVAITSVEQEASKNKAFFTINVKNVGGGRIFDLGYLSRCNPYNPNKVSEKNLNVVYLADARIGKDRLDCEIPNNRIKLVNGQGQIRCTYDYRYASSKNAYETPLILELWYGYSDTTQRSVYIKRIT